MPRAGFEPASPAKGPDVARTRTWNHIPDAGIHSRLRQRGKWSVIGIRFLRKQVTRVDIRAVA